MHQSTDQAYDPVYRTASGMRDFSVYQGHDKRMSK